MQEKIRIAVQVLNGATGECREVVARVAAKDAQQAVDKLFSHARRDDFYYRFLSMTGVVAPTSNATPVTYNNQTYYALEA